MALVFFDGCGEYYDTAQMEKVFIKTGTPTVEAAGGRRGGASIECQVNESFTLGVAPIATYIIGCALKASSFTITRFLSTYWGTRSQVNLRIATGGGINVYSDNTLIGSTAAGLMTLNEYSYIEVKIFISDTVGTVEVKIDGGTALSLTGQDTKHNSADAAIDRIVFGAPTGNDMQFDDLYILDTTGSAPQNDFLGDVQIDAVFPDGDGTTSDFDTTFPASPTTHYTKVDENPATDDTDYNETPTLNDVDLFTFANLATITGGSDLVGVKASALMRRTDAGTVQAELVARPTTTNFSSTAKPLGTGYTYHHGLWDTDPDGAAWTDSSFNSSEFGVKVVA